MKTAFKFGSGALCLCALAGIGASLASPAEQVQQAQPETRAAIPFDAALDDMSTGRDQAVLTWGGDARSLNAQIPLKTGETRTLSAHAPIADDERDYPSALKCLTQAIYYEAANEELNGKRAVAQVVLNRMRHPAYPNSVCGVVYQGVNDPVCQFSFTCDGALQRPPLERQWTQSQSVAREALAGKQMRAVGTATHYHADYVVPKWAYTLSKLQVIGTHIFYRFPGSAGEPRAFAAKWRRSERIPDIDMARFSAREENFLSAEHEDSTPLVPGLTVVRVDTDRHAATDVGGRIDTTKPWRLSIPDPVSAPGTYDRAIAAQAGAPDIPAAGQ